MPGARLEIDERLLEQWCRPRDEQPDVVGLLLAEVALPEQARVIRRYAHQHRALRQIAHDLADVVAGQPAHAGAGQQRAADGDEQAVDVEDRQRVQQAIGIAESPGLHQRLGVSQQVRVRQHDALRHARRARRIEQRGHVVPVARHDGRVRRRLVGTLGQRATAVAVEREYEARTRGVGDVLDRGFPLRVADHGGRLGVVQEVLEFCRRVRHVEWVKDEATAQAGQVQAKRFGGFLDLDRHPVAWLDAEAAEQ